MGGPGSGRRPKGLKIARPVTNVRLSSLAQGKISVVKGKNVFKRTGKSSVDEVHSNLSPKSKVFFHRAGPKVRRKK